MLGEKIRAATATTADEGWDLAFAEYNGANRKFFSVAAQELTPQGVFFKPDGTKMYVIGDTGDAVNEYNLSVAWDLSTVVFLQLFSIAAQELTPTGIFFKPDGTKMYVVGSDGDEVNEYNLSVAWDISTASFLQLFSVAAQETGPTGVFFKPDGTKMYVIGSTGDAVNEYNLLEAWNVGAAALASPQFSVTAQELTPTGIFFKPDGTKMYVVGSDGDEVNEYNLHVPWSVSTAFFPTFSVAAQETSPQGVFFKPDGTKMYVIGATGDDVNEYNLSVAWDISTASFLQLKSVAAQETAPRGLFFKPDGTKMYVVGSDGDEVNEYNLSIAWDISTAAFLQLFSVASQETVPTGVFFKPDGTKMYVIGSTGDDVNEYNLSVAWDISTASFLQLFSVAAQDSSPQGVFFKPDGTKMYVIGNANDSVYEYNLSVAWDISTASFLQLFSVTAQEITPTGVFFKPDGTKMYVIGETGDNVYEYNLSVAWDISTASFPIFSVAAQEITPQGVFFKPDGTKMYVIGDTGDDVNEYNLSVAWDISTASFLQLFSVAAQEITPTNVFFKPDGTKMYVIGSTGDDVNEYNLSVAWDISTASFLQLFSVAAQETLPQGVFFKPDGTKMYVIGSSGDDVNEYNLSVAWDISTASFLQLFSVATQETAPTGVFFEPDGTKMYVIGTANDTVYEYNLLEAWNVSTAVLASPQFSVAAQETVPQDVFFKPDGTKMYVIGSAGDDVNEYNLRVPWSVSTASFPTFSVAAQELTPAGVFFKPDGTKMYVIGSAGDDVNEYNLSVAWDISTASFLQLFSVAAQETTPAGVFFKPDGTKMYVIGSAGDDVNEYNLSVAWDISTASFLQLFSVAAQETTPQGVFFKPDGTKMYVIGSAGDEVNEYNLSVAWNVTTASFLQLFSVAAQDSSPQGVFFKPDGTKMYVIGNANDSVYEYNLSVAWDISTASFLQLKSVAAQEAVPTGVFFKPDGTKMYVIGSDGDDVNEYNLSVAWDISTASFPIFSVAAQEITPTGMFFEPDGTKMYVIGDSGDNVYEYNLSVAWDIFTAIYTYPTTDYYSVAAQDLTPEGVFFKPDGTKMYVIGDSGDNVYEYNLSVAWDISTAAFLQLFSVASQEITPTGVFFKPDGTKMYVLGNTGDDVNEYNLSVAWDISTAAFLQLFSVATQDLTPEGVFFRDDGTKMYVIGETGDNVYEYNLSVAWDVSTAIFRNPVFSVAAQETVPRGLFFKPDGTKMYVTGASGDDVNEYNLSIAWDISTASFLQLFSVAAQETEPEDVFFKPDGTKMYVIGSINNSVYEYNLSVAWDISTASFLQLFSVAAQETDPQGVFFKPDGTKMYVVGLTGDDVNEYNLSVAWNVTTASFLQLFSIAAQEAAPTGVFFKPDGTKMYVIGSAGDDVNEYNLSIAWDISTASFLQLFSVAAQDILPQGVFFRDDGLNMYVIGQSNDNVYEYKLSVAWDISTARLALPQFSVAAQETTPTGVFFKPDGTKMYVIGQTGDDVNEYNLSVAWDVTTASFVQLFSVASVEITPTDVFFKPDGKKMYIIGDTSDAIWAYDL
jgi:DNA-binding beta-propeller fold protein YncE